MKTIVFGSNKGKDKVNSSAENSKAEKDKVDGLPASTKFGDDTKMENAAKITDAQKPEREKGLVHVEQVRPEVQKQNPLAQKNLQTIQATMRSLKLWLIYSMSDHNKPL